MIELRPRDTCDWCRIQKIAQNPHIRVSMGVQRRLSSLIKCLEKKWRSHDTKVKTMLINGQEETSDGENSSTTTNQGGILVLLPPRGAIIKDPQHRKTENEERSKRPKVKINWRIYTKNPNDPLIRDLIIEGLSLARTQKEEFASIIETNDGNIEALFNTLKDFIN